MRSAGNNSQLRLAVFTNQFPSRVSTFFARDVRALVETGVDVDVFPFYPLDPDLWRYVPDILDEQALPRSKVFHTNIFDSLSCAPRGLTQIPAFTREAVSLAVGAVPGGLMPLVKDGYVSLKAWSWAHRHDNRYDHVLAYWGNHAATAAYLFHRLTNREVPFSVFVHAGIDLYQPTGQLRRKLLYADNIITCSEFNRTFLRRQFPDIFSVLENKIHVHHHGLDLTTLLYQPDHRLPRTVIAVGTLEKYKGFDYLLRAIAELKSRQFDTALHLVGDGREAKALRNLAAQLQISDRVHFQGWLRPQEVCDQMAKATILVHPSPALGDGVPNVIKEAMALGTPIIASHVAGIPELLQDGAHGILVPPKDVQALAQGIERLLMDDALRRKCADGARRHAETHFDVWQRGRDLAHLLRSTKRRPQRAD